MKYHGIYPVILLVLFSASSTTFGFPTARSHMLAPFTVTTAATPTPTPQISEQEAYDNAVSNVDTEKRIDAIGKFLANFPDSEHTAVARELLIAAYVDAGKTKISNVDLAGAEASFLAAVHAAPDPVPDAVFSETLMPLPTLLIAVGQQAAAFRVVKAIEEKIAGNASQMLRVADFYLRSEDGTDGARIAAAILEEGPNADAYRTLGLANRIDFRMEEAAAAFQKALEIEPDSRPTKMMLADMLRALGRSDEARVIYSGLLEEQPEDQQARAGLVLALFDEGKRTDAEAELAKAAESSNGNVLMLAGAAYWYAANGDGKRAVELAQKAIAIEPRFVWSHIALAKGYMLENRPIDAERTLIGAKKYGNFPTLDYEIASARIAAGLYREAGELLDQRFSLGDEGISTRLGGRIPKSSNDFVSLLDAERQASILAPRSADSEANAGKVLRFFQLYRDLQDASVADDVLAKSADTFIDGSDKMRIHRLLYTAKELLSRNRIPEKVEEYAALAIGKDDAGLEVASPVSAVLADQLYEPRQKAASRDEYIQIPEVPRRTLSAILRGRIEEISGTVLLEKNDAEEAIIRLRRAVSVLPAETPWWRSSVWKLGTALESQGKLDEALEFYVKCYKSDYPDGDRYSVIEALYKKMHDGTQGLDKMIGPDPRPGASEVAVVEAEVSPTPGPSPVPTPLLEDKPEAPVEIGATTDQMTPSPTPTPEAEPTKKPEESGDDTSMTLSPTATATPTPDATPEPTPSPDESPAPDTTRSPGSSVTTPQASPTPSKDAIAKNEPKSIADLFPPVVISVPKPPKAEKRAEPITDTKTTDDDTDRPDAQNEAPASADEIVLGDGRKSGVAAPNDGGADKCTLTLSDENLLLKMNGGELSVIVGTEDDRDLDGLKVITDRPEDIAVRKEPIPGIKGRALYVIRAVGNSPGEFKVAFELPCGRKELTVTVH